MGKIHLLDCTLRDGGYINDWKFGESAIRDICRQLARVGVEAIEIGFIKGDRFSTDRTMFPNVECIAELLRPKAPSITYVGMLDMSAPIPLERITPFDGSSVDALRVIFKKNRIEEGFEYCREVKARGYKLFVQFVGTDNYSDVEFVEAIKKFNALEPDVIYIVDSFGLMRQKDFMRRVQLADNNLIEGAALGYHSHNNLQQALGNAIAFAEFHCNRDKFIDATVFGMGRGAGNLNLELFIDWLNGNFGTHYDPEPLIDIVSDHLDAIYAKNPWGYSMPLYLSAINDCHPNYPIYYSANHRLTLRELADLIKSIAPDERKNYSATKAESFFDRFKFDREYDAEKARLDGRTSDCDDAEALERLRSELDGRSILLIGPGNNINRQRTRVQTALETLKPISIAVNYAPPDIPVDYIFLSNAKRYSQLRFDLPENINANAKIIATSNVTKVDGSFDCVLNYASLIDRSTEIIDNSLVMLLIRPQFPRVGRKRSRDQFRHRFEIQQGRDNIINNEQLKIKTSILGTGNIGTDLLVKLQRSKRLQCTLFAGRSAQSNGIKFAAARGVPVSARSIDAIVEDPQCCDIVFDATNAAAHKVHAPILRRLKKFVIDLTPALVGKMCVPVLNLDECLKVDNVNMITCGGQATVPLAAALGRVQPNVKYIEIVAGISSRSAGAGTRANIDEFTQTTGDALAHFSNVGKTKAIIILNSAEPPVHMRNTLYALVDEPNLPAIRNAVDDMVKRIQKYVPGYRLLYEPVFENGRITMAVEVVGQGDYLPKYAGNLDIITCAAVEVAEHYAQKLIDQRLSDESRASA